MPTPLAGTKVFEPLQVGKLKLNHRIVFAPTTRFRATAQHVPTDLELEYYDKRSKFPGSLLITEATLISPQAGLYAYVPGIWNEEQTVAWKKIVDVIHANKSFACLQLWNLGRAGEPDLLKKAGLPFVSSSAIYESDESRKKAEKWDNPLRAMTSAEIQDMIYNQYLTAAENAFEAGFDVLELHGAHGYLLDQFQQPSSNQRDDEYGGSIEKRARLTLEVIDLLSAKFGAHRIAIRFSPWAKFKGILAEEDVVHPIVTFGYLLHELQKRADEGKELAYISIVEPRVQGTISVGVKDIKGSNDFIYQIWKGKILRSGNYTYDAPEFKQIIEDTNNGRTMVGFARYYTSNPDLVYRLKDGLDLTTYDRKFFYGRANYRYNTWGNYGEDEVDKEHPESKRSPMKL